MSMQLASLRDRILEVAESRKGIPYRIDPPPDGTNNLDCSLFVKLTLDDAEIGLPADVRTAEQIRQACDPVAWEAVDKGDLLFFEGTTDAPVQLAADGHHATHVGISLGRGTQRMWDCHASSGDAGPPGVGITDISTAFWQPKLFQAGRPRGFGTPVARFEVAFAQVRLRALPSTSAPILVDDVGQGATVVGVSVETIEADGHRWRNVRTRDGEVGWIADDLLQPPGLVDLTSEADHVFSFAELWPHIQIAAGRFGADAEVAAAIIKQESGFANVRVHRDGTGHGLLGLDDNGLLPDFEQWSGLQCGRGASAISIPPKQQIEYATRVIAAYTLQFGSAINAARVWHRGQSLWQDELGQHYEDLIRGHLLTLFGRS